MSHFWKNFRRNVEDAGQPMIGGKNLRQMPFYSIIHDLKQQKGEMPKDFEMS